MRTKRGLRPGAVVDITRGDYRGHWGTIIAMDPDADAFTVTGGSIGTIAPQVGRRDFVVRIDIDTKIW